MSVKVSVILPTYNRSKMLPGAIASVLGQSMGDLELIVVDDASNEDIRGVVEAVSDPRIRYLRRDVNGGAGAARNSGIEVARGAYIAFQDSDDLWLPDKLSSQLSIFEGLLDQFGVVTGPKIFYGRDARLRYGPGRISITPDALGILDSNGDQVGALLRDNRLSVQCALFRCENLRGFSWFDPCARANEDWELAVRLSQRTRIYEDAAPVLLGMVSQDSISRNRRRQIIGVLRILKNNRVLLERYRPQRAALMRDVARALAATHKPRLGARFVLASVIDYPPSALSIFPAIWRRLQAPLATVGRRFGQAS